MAPSYMKRFSVSSITRDREYDIVGNAKEPKYIIFQLILTEEEKLFSSN